MFKLQPDPTFSAPVRLSIPGGETAVVDLTFRHKTRDGLKAYFETAAGRADDDLVSEIVAGWSGIDADYSAKNLATLLANYPAAAGEIVNAYAQALTAARLGN